MRRSWIKKVVVLAIVLALLPGCISLFASAIGVGTNQSNVEAFISTYDDEELKELTEEVKENINSDSFSFDVITKTFEKGVFFEVYTALDDETKEVLAGKLSVEEFQILSSYTKMALLTEMISLEDVVKDEDGKEIKKEDKIKEYTDIYLGFLSKCDDSYSELDDEALTELLKSHQKSYIELCTFDSKLEPSELAEGETLTGYIDLAKTDLDEEVRKDFTYNEYVKFLTEAFKYDVEEITEEVDKLDIFADKEALKADKEEAQKGFSEFVVELYSRIVSFKDFDLSGDKAYDTIEISDSQRDDVGTVLPKSVIVVLDNGEEKEIQVTWETFMDISDTENTFYVYNLVLGENQVLSYELQNKIDSDKAMLPYVEVNVTLSDDEVVEEGTKENEGKEEGTSSETGDTDKVNGEEGEGGSGNNDANKEESSESASSDKEPTRVEYNEYAEYSIKSFKGYDSTDSKPYKEITVKDNKRNEAYGQFPEKVDVITDNNELVSIPVQWQTGENFLEDEEITLFTFGIRLPEGCELSESYPINKSLGKQLLPFLAVGLEGRNEEAEVVEDTKGISTFGMKDNQKVNVKYDHQIYSYYASGSAPEWNAHGVFKTSFGGGVVFCAEHGIDTIVSEGNNKDLTFKYFNSSQKIRKILYYGYGGPKQWSGFGNSSNNSQYNSGTLSKTAQAGVCITAMQLSYTYKANNLNTDTPYNYNIQGREAFNTFLSNQPDPPPGFVVYRYTNEGKQDFFTWKESGATMSINYYSNRANSASENASDTDLDGTNNVKLRTVTKKYDDSMGDLRNASTMGLKKTGHTPNGYWYVNYDGFDHDYTGHVKGGTGLHEDTDFKSAQAFAEKCGENFLNDSFNVNLRVGWRDNVVTTEYNAYSNSATLTGTYKLGDDPSTSTVEKTMILVSSSGAVFEKSCNYHQSLAVAKFTNLKRDGYTFQGWRYKDDAKDYVRFTAGASYPATTIDSGIANGDVKRRLYAVWKENAKTYKITVNGNGGTPGISQFYELYGVKFFLSDDNDSPMSSIPVATRHQHDFQGYGTASSNSFNITNSTGSPIQVANTYFTSDSTIYANWLPHAKIAVEGNGGTAGVGTLWLSYARIFYTNTSTQSAVSSIPPGSRGGYYFTGYYTHPYGEGYGTKVTDENGRLLVSTTFIYPDGDVSSTDLTIYACWVPGFNVSYNANGGTGAPPTQGFKGSAENYLWGTNNYTTPTRAGHTFQFWSGESSRPEGFNGGDGQQVVNINGSYIKRACLTHMSGERYELMVYAVNTSSVNAPTWTAENGQDDLTWHSVGAGSWSRGGQSYNFGTQISITAGHKGEINNYITHLYAYDSNGNTLESAGVPQYDFTFDQNASGERWYLERDTTLYAQWKANNYYFDVNHTLDGTAMGNSKDSGVGTFDVYINGTQVADDVGDYYAQHPHGSTYEVKDIKALDGGKYTYSGTFKGTINASNAAVTIPWTTIKRTLTVNPNGGTWNGKTSSTTYTGVKGNTQAIANNPTRSGYTFAGWQLSGTGSFNVGGTDANFSNGTSNVSVYNNSGNGTVTHARESIVTPVGNYRIKITKASGTSSPGMGGFYNGTASASGQKFVHVFVANLPRGYSFMNAQNNCGDGYTVDWLTPREGTGQWTVYAYRTNCGTSGSFSTFGHVYVDGSTTGTVTWYLASSQVYNTTSSNVFTYKAGNATLTALWAPNNHKITFNPNGGTNATNGNLKGYNWVSVTRGKSNYYAMSGDKPTRANYDFQGWYTSIGASSSVLSSTTGRVDMAGTGRGWKMTEEDAGRLLRATIDVVDSSLASPPSLQFNDVTLSDSSYAVEKITNGWRYDVDLIITSDMVSLKGSTPYNTTYRFFDFEGVKTTTKMTPLGIFLDGSPQSVAVYDETGMAVNRSSAPIYWSDNTWQYNGDITVYAYWTPKPVNVKYDHWAWGFTNNEGNNSSKNAFNLGLTPDKAGYGTMYTATASKAIAPIPKGFYLQNSVGTSLLEGSWKNYTLPYKFRVPSYDVTFEMDYYPNTYSITYNMNGGTNASSNPASYNILYGVSLANPTKTGHVFKGWYLNDAGKDYTFGASTSNWNYQRVKEGCKPGETYNIKIANAKVTSGSATQFTTLVYDFTTSTTLNQYTTNFGSNIEYQVAVPSTADASHDIAVIVYSGVGGATANVASSFTGVSVGEKVTGINEGANASFTSAADLHDKLETRRIGNVTLTATWENSKYRVRYNDGSNLLRDINNIGTVTSTKSEYSINNGVVTVKALADDGYTPYTSINVYLENGKTYTFEGTCSGTWSTQGQIFFMKDKSTANNDYFDITAAKKTFTHTKSTGTYWLRFDSNRSGETITFKDLQVYEGSTDPNTSGHVENTQHVYGTASPLSSSVFNKDGYTFTGWNTEADGSGTSYSKGQSVTNLATANGAAVDLYAQWERAFFEATYDPNGGTFYTSSGGLTGAIQYVNYEYGDVDTIIGSRGFVRTERTGYNLVGWKITNTATGSATDIGGAKVTFDPTTKEGTFTQGFVNVTITAQWEPIKYTITYDSNGGSEVPAQTYTVEDKVVLAAGPTKADYSFDKWNLATDEGTWSKGDYTALQDMGTGNRGNITLKAKWKADEYNITYISNMGLPAGYKILSYIYPTNGAYIDTGYKPNNTTGVEIEHNFLYNSSASILGAGNGDGEEFKISYANELMGWGFGSSYTPEESRFPVDILAVYSGKQRITLNLNNDRLGTVKGVVYDDTLSSKTMSKINHNLYIFGFNNAGVAEGTYSTSSSMGGVHSVRITEGYNTVRNFIACQSPEGAIGMYDTVEGKFYKRAASATGSFSTFDKYYTTYKAGSTVSFPSPVKSYYTFGGWYDNPDFTGSKLTGTPKGSTGDKIYYAKWTPVKYNITYDLDGGTLPSGKSNPASYTYEDAKVIQYAPSKEGYRFIGWQETTSGEVGNKYSFENITDGNSLSAMKLQLWKNGSYVGQLGSSSGVGSYSDTYTFTGETGNYSIRYGANGSKADYCIYSDFYLEKGKTYKFGWNVTGSSSQKIDVENIYFYAQDGENPGPYSEIRKYSSGAKSYKALYERIQVNLTFDKRGGTGGTDKVNDVIYGEALPDITLPTKAGNIFHGYYADDVRTELTTSGANYGAANGTYRVSMDGGWNWTAEDAWRNIKAVITLNDSGLSSAPAIEFNDTVMKSDMYSVEKISGGYKYTIDMEIPANFKLATSYRFLDFVGITDNTTATVSSASLGGNLYYAAEGKGTRVSDFETDQTLYARWEKIPYTLTVKAGTGIASVTPSGSYTHYYGDSISINATLKTGYEWKNWTGSGISDIANQNHTFSMPANDVTLTANATPVVFTISYDANGGEGTISDQKVTWGTSFSINTGADLYKKGYTFNGWTTIKPTTHEGEDDGLGWKGTGIWDYVSGTAGVKDNKLQLYARWTPNKYTVEYYVDDTKVGTSSHTYNNEIVNWSKQYDSHEGDRGEYLNTGIDLAPIIDEQGTGKYVIEFDAKATKDGWMQVYMQNGSGARYSMSEQFNITTDWDHYRFETNISLQNSSLAQSLLAFYSEYGSGRFPHVKNIEFHKLDEPLNDAHPKKYHDFVSWKRASDGKEFKAKELIKNWASEEGAVVRVDGTYKLSDYTISYDANGGTGSMSSHVTHYGESVKIKDNEFTAPAGYRFNGWTTTKPTTPEGVNDGHGWSTGSQPNIKGWSGTWAYDNGQYGIKDYKLHLYARWEKVGGYVDGSGGNDANNGATPSTPVETIKQAYKNLQSSGGTIYIVDTADIEGNVTLDKTYYKDESGTINIASGKEVKIMRYSQPTAHAELDGFNVESFTDTYNSTLINIGHGVDSNSKLVLESITIDGHKNAVTSGSKAEIAPGIEANGNMIAVNSDATLINNNATIQNNSSMKDYNKISPYNSMGHGAVEVEGTFTMNGGILQGHVGQYGGAVFVGDGTFIMNGGTITDNYANEGSAINNQRGFVKITGGELSNGSANVGGAIVNYEDMEITGGTISDNTALESCGGVMNGQGYNLSISGGTISDNTAPIAAGVANAGSLNITGGTISNNKATMIGGGIVNQGALTMSDGTISGNTAPIASGVALLAPMTMIDNASVAEDNEIGVVKDMSYVVVGSELSHDTAGIITPYVADLANMTAAPHYENGLTVAVADYGSKVASDVISHFKLTPNGKFTLRPGDNLDDSVGIADTNVIISTPYSLTYNKNTTGSPSNMPSSQNAYWNEPNAVASTAPSMAGYRFNGWNTVANGSGTTYKPGVKLLLTKDITLYAQWEKLGGYVDGINGNDNNSGSVADKPVKTLKQAYANLKDTGGTIYVVGETPVNANANITKTYYKDGSSEITLVSGKEVSIKRYSKPTDSVSGFTTGSNKGTMLVVPSGYTLSVGDIVVDGHGSAYTSSNNYETAGAVEATLNSVEVEEGGTLKIAGATITNHDIAPQNSVIASSGTIQMTSGSVSNNDCLNQEAINVLKGTLTMSGGEVSNNTGTGIRVDNGKVTLSGGTVSENSTGVYVNKTGTLVISGSNIDSNDGDGVTSRGIVTMSSGSVNNNGSVGIGVHGGSGKLTISGGTVEDNKTDGVSVQENTELIVTGGSISYNGLDGISVDTSTLDFSNATVEGNNERGIDLAGTATMSSGTIVGNKIDGVTVYKGTFSFEGGTISENEVYGIRNAYEDCEVVMTGGEIVSNVEDAILNEGTLTVTGGIIESNDSGLANHGTATLSDVSIINNIENGIYNAATLTINSGTVIEGNNLGISNASKGTLVINDVSINNNTTSGMENQGVATMNGGTISENAERGVINMGTFKFKGGEISENSNSGIDNMNATVEISGGTIYGNSYTSGAGVYNRGADAKVTMTGGTIENNTARNGAGVRNTNGALFDMSAGSIVNNTTSGSSYDGSGIKNEDSTVRLSGTAKISGNTKYDIYQSGTLEAKGTPVVDGVVYLTPDHFITVVDKCTTEFITEMSDADTFEGRVLANYTFSESNQKAKYSLESKTKGYATIKKIGIGDKSLESGTYKYQILLVPNMVTATFDPNGGSTPDPDTIVGPARDPIGELPTSEREGGILEGWYTDPEGGTKITPDTPMPEEDTIYYAHWTPIEYTVKYDKNESAGVSKVKGTVSDSTGIKYDFEGNENYTIKDNAYSREGYDFIGWNTKADGTGTSYVEGQKVCNLANTQGAVITMYAQWKLKDYDITYKLNDGVLPNGKTNPVKYNIETPTFDLNNPTKEKNTFLGWKEEGSIVGLPIDKEQSIKKGIFSFEGNTWIMKDTVSGHSFDGISFDLYDTDYNKLMALDEISGTDHNKATMEFPGATGSYLLRVGAVGSEDSVIYIPIELVNGRTYYCEWDQTKVSDQEYTIDDFHIYYEEHHNFAVPSSVITGSVGAKTFEAMWDKYPEIAAVDDYRYVGDEVDVDEIKKNAIANDAEDGNISEDVKVESIKYPDGTVVENPTKLDTSKEAVVEVTYSVTDSAGGKSEVTAKIYIFALPDPPDFLKYPVVYTRFISGDTMIGKGGLTALDTLTSKSWWFTKADYRDALIDSVSRDVPLDGFDYINAEE